MAHCRCSSTVFKKGGDLNDLIDDLWKWETVEETVNFLGKSRYEIFRDAADTECVWQGHWPPRARIRLNYKRRACPHFVQSHFVQLARWTG